MKIFDLSVNSIQGQPTDLRSYEGKTLVIVNVASKCGLTPQYAELQLFYEEYKEKGLEILGFPANNFAGQEPGTDAEIEQFCTTNYGVTFPMFSKISVKGEGQHPLYKLLTEQTGEEVTWNFQKFVVDRSGSSIKSFAPTVSVLSPEFKGYIDSILN